MSMSLASAFDQRPVSPSRRASFWPKRGADRPGLAIAPGTAPVRLGGTDRILVEEPSALVRCIDGEVLAVGGETRAVVGRNPRGVEVIEPIDDAVVTDIGVAEILLQRLLRRAGISGTRTRVAVVAVPSSVDDLHRRALRQCVQRSMPKASLVPLESPMAAAIGAGLPVEEAFGSMVVDVGRGITEAAVVSMGTMVTARAAPLGGATAEAAVVTHLADRHDVEIGRHTAERVVRFSSLQRYGVVLVRGTDRNTGLPRAVQMTRAEVAAIFEPVVEGIAMVAKNALDAAPAALAADVMDGRIVLTGGASKLDGLAPTIEARTGIAVRIRPSPDRAVIDGARLCLGGAMQTTVAGA